MWEEIYDITEELCRCILTFRIFMKYDDIIINIFFSFPSNIHYT